jgi:hypothetical protein
MFAPCPSIVTPNMVSVFTKQIGWIGEDYAATTPASSTYESANRAVYWPLIIPAVCVVRRLWWANGSSVSASYNIDVGVYTSSNYGPGEKLVSSGSTAQGTATQVQFVDVTDTTVAPGLYWLAISVSSASATIMRISLLGGAGHGDAAVRFEEASALPLPATATPVEGTVSNIYLCGFATTASP